MPSERRGRRERARLEEMLRLRPPEQTLAWSEVDRVDDERLWWTLRGMGRDRLLVLLARALDEVPAHRLESVLGDHVRPGDIGAPRDQARPGVLALVEKFCDLARRGHFYEAMDYRGSQQSAGTELFVAQFTTLMDRCVNDVDAAPSEVTATFELLFDLMRSIDDNPDNLVYFTDESGSWQLNVQWKVIVPAYFESLARTVSEAEFDRRVSHLLRDFGEDVDVSHLEPLSLAREVWARVAP